MRNLRILIATCLLACLSPTCFAGDPPTPAATGEAPPDDSADELWTTGSRIGDLEAAIQRGEQALQDGLLDVADAAFAEARSLDWGTPQNLRVLLGSGVTAYRRGDMANAGSYYRTAVASYPDNEAAVRGLAAVKEADAGFERQLKAEEKHIQQEATARALTDAIGAFGAGYQAGTEIENARRQAEAEASASAQGQAQPTYSVQPAVAPQAPASSASPAASFASMYGDKTRFLHEQTGQPCVTPGRQYSEPRGDGTNYRWEFRNICGREFVVWTTSKMVDPNTSPLQSNGIRAGSPQAPNIMTMTCVYSTNNLSQSCNGFVEYDVR
jgi:hypothetical protein